MSRKIILRPVLGLLAAGVLAVFAATPVAAYGGGPATWQLTFAGTGHGFGFWGWCEFSGGSGFAAPSGTSGDCQFAEYLHIPGVVSATCELSLNLTEWHEAAGATGGPDWFFSGTALTHAPSPATAAVCGSLPGSPPPVFSNYDSLLPVAIGHTNASGFFGTTELQIQETPIPV